jgi:hypothetical protein
LAAEDAKKQKAEEAEAKRQAAEDAKKQKAEEAEAKRKQQQDEVAAKKQAAEDAKRQKTVAMNTPPPTDTGHIDISGRQKRMLFVGFQQQAASSRVYVKTNEPVRYSVSEGVDKTVVLELENTRIAMRNNERFLDTSYFDTPVEKVSPEAGPTRSVRIAIKLKESVPYQAKQDGNEVSLEFQRPAKK